MLYNLNRYTYGDFPSVEKVGRPNEVEQDVSLTSTPGCLFRVYTDQLLYADI
jgi:hypothetical protein